MAIYHLEAKVVSRGTGRSAVAASAYLSCTNILNDYDGVRHDYTRKKGLIWREVFLPEYAPPEWKDRGVLWNAVEENEKTKDSRLAREFVPALPVELTPTQWQELLSDFIKESFVADGMCADVAIHDPYPPGHNPHAHILLTVRPLDERGEWQYKSEKEYLCVKDGEERGFTAAEFKAAQADGWEKQYPYKVGRKKVYMPPSEAEKQGLERASKHPKSTKFGRQKKLLEDYAKEHGFTNCVHFTDDGWSGANFDRPNWKRMIAAIEAGEVSHVLVKDLSRVGRDYLQVGFYTEVMFREHGVRFVAIANGVDSDKRESSEFAPFLNIMNEWYVRDSSRKIKSVLRAKGMSGIHTNSIGIYGYKKDPNDKNHWIVDDEAAEVVRRIYRMAIEGKGPYEIARILASEKVERPSYYLAQRGLGKHKTSYNPDEPYTWRGGTVADILSKPEYIGHTVNFRTYKESYKDKHSKMTPKEDLVIFENTQEAIIDKETWERVQTLRKTIRRTDTIGTANPLTGLMFCADCGAKMYNHRGKAGNARDWAGRPTGKKRPDRDEYNCSRYDLGNQHFDDYCTTHLIRTAVVNELLLEAIKEVCDYAQNNEAEFMAQVCSASEDRQAKAAKAIRQRKQRSEKRTDELSRLIRKLYEDNVNGRLSDKLFEQMLHDFEAELEGLTDSITQDQQELDRISRETVNAEKFLALVKKYTDFSELTPAMINEFVEKILVHQAEGKGASRTQEVEIFFNFIGKVEIPRKEIELTEEEKAALAEQERRRAKKAEYNRRYMEKKRRQWKEQQEREKEQQEALELPAASTEKGERIA